MPLGYCRLGGDFSDLQYRRSQRKPSKTYWQQLLSTLGCKSTKIAKNAMAMCIVHLVMLTMKIPMEFFTRVFGDPKYLN